VDTVKTTAFCNLPKEALVKLISSDYLGLEEEDVWRAVLNWAKYQVRINRVVTFGNKNISRKRTEQMDKYRCFGISALFIETLVKEDWNIVVSSVLAYRSQKILGNSDTSLFMII